MEVDFKWVGYDKTFQALESEIGRFTFRSGKNLERAARFIMDESYKLTPIMDANLISTGYVKKQGALGKLKTLLTKKSISVTLGYSSPYARVTHENPRSGKTKGVGPPPRYRKYKKWAKVGQWKFLEQPLLQNHKQILDIIAGRR